MELFWIVVILVLLILESYVNKNYENFLKWVNRISSKKISEKKMRETKNYKQNSLAPKLLEGKDLKKIQPYIDRLDESVRMPDVYNVALMSLYGAGKSTILRNFENIHNEYNYLNLTLGSYSSKKSDEILDEQGNKINLDVNEKLENSLVKQMIYREKKSKLPYSRFKKIDNISKSKLLIFFVLEGLGVISILFLNNIFSFRKIMTSNFLWVKNNLDLLKLISYAFFLIAFLLVLFILVRAILRQFSISKLSVGNVAIEGNEASMSYFNKYIDEILYYFEINKFNVVVIEDVDRFGSIEVFEHLKELNLLLNNSRQIKRKITFIYAVKEDVFSKSKEEIEEHESELRTKFFDLIIPVIPVIDTFNSRDYLLKLMKEKEDVNLTDDFILFLKNISLYIYDLRILTNIVNEYETYLEVHSELAESLSKQKLFSMITLKNLIPSEYTGLQKSQGTIYDLLMGKKYEDIISKEENEKKERVETSLSEIDKRIEKQKVSDAKLIFEKMGYFDVTEINLGKSWLYMSNFSIDTVNTIRNMDMANFEIKYNQENIVALNTNEYRRNLEAFYDNKSSTLSGLISEREDLVTIADVLTHNRGNYNTFSLENKMKYYPSLSLLIKQELKNINDYNLVVFLISNGYVAEDYSNYLSLYYDEGLKIRDKEYIVKLKSNQKVDFEYNLEDIKEVLFQIDPFDYDNIGILNKDILLAVSSDTGDKMDRIMRVFFTQDKDNIKQQIDIILSEDKDQTSKLICCFMMEKYNNLIDIVSDKNIFSDRVIYSFQNVTNSRSNYIDYLRDIKENISLRTNLYDDLIKQEVKIIPFLESLELYNQKHDEKILLDSTLISLNNNEKTNLFEKKLYGLKNNTLSEVLGEYGTEIQQVFYKDILGFGDQTLIDHVNQNIDIFIEETLLLNEILVETNESFVELVNIAYLDVVKDTNFDNLLKRFNSRIAKLSDIQNSNLWNRFMSTDKCKVNWKNLYSVINYDEIESIDMEDISVILDVLSSEEKVEKLIKDYQNNQETANNFYTKFVSRVNIHVENKKIIFNYPEHADDLDFDDDDIIRYESEIRSEKLVELFKKLESVIE